MIDRDLIKYTKRFDESIEKHVLTVTQENLNEGFLRLRIKNPESFNLYYDIIAWPDVLCLHGDAGALMLRDRPGWFLKSDRSQTLKNMGAYHEDHLDRARYTTGFFDTRVLACEGDRRQFSFDVFIKDVNLNLKEFRLDHPSVAQEQIDELFEELHEYESSECPEEAYKVCEEWSFNVAGDSDALICFSDLPDHTAYTYWFTWYCLAVVHALKLYDAHKAREAA